MRARCSLSAQMFFLPTHKACRNKLRAADSQLNSHLSKRIRVVVSRLKS